MVFPKKQPTSANLANFFINHDLRLKKTAPDNKNLHTASLGYTDSLVEMDTLGDTNTFGETDTEPALSKHENVANSELSPYLIRN